MLQLNNQTPFQAKMSVFPDAQGVDTLCLLVRASFSITPVVKLLEQQPEPQLVDEWYGEPGQSSLKYGGELHLGKPSSDVVLVGQAWAPNAKAVAELPVGLAVGSMQQRLQVSGDRFWQGGSISKPLPFEQMPLVYENAYGGVHQFEAKNGELETLFEPRNPVGKGFVGKRKGKELDGLSLPNIEHPAQLIRASKDQPDPAGWGYVAPSWEPRRSYAGSYDEQWQKSRAPYLPLDFNARFFNAAAPQFICPGFLQGGEKVQLINVAPDSRLSFHLPKVAINLTVDVAGELKQPALVLQTLLLEPEQNRFSLYWFARQACDKQALKIRQVLLQLAAGATL